MLEIFIRWLEKILWKFSFQIFIIREEPGCLGTKRHSNSQKTKEVKRNPNQILEQTKLRGRGAAFPARRAPTELPGSSSGGRSVCFCFRVCRKRAGQEICRRRHPGRVDASRAERPTHPKNIWFDPHLKETVENHFTNQTLSCGIRTVKLYLHTDS